VLVKDVAGNLVDEGVRNPGSVVSSGDLAVLVCPDLLHSDLVGLGVIFDRDLRRHSAHGSDFAPKHVTIFV